jgi:hypothetical protein
MKCCQYSVSSWQSALCQLTLSSRVMRLRPYDDVNDSIRSMVEALDVEITGPAGSTEHHWYSFERENSGEPDGPD